MKGSTVALIGGGVILFYMIGNNQGNAAQLTSAQLAALQTAQGQNAYNNALNAGGSVASALAAALSASGVSSGGGINSGVYQGIYNANNTNTGMTGIYGY